MTTQTPPPTKTTLYEVLSKRNAHPRDQDILFEEEGHKYTILPDPDSKYTSVTTWNHSHFPHFDADSVIQNMMKGRNWNPKNKYWGLTPEQIKQQWSNNGASVSSLGTNMHYEIECFMNCPELLEHPTYTHADLLLKKENPFAFASLNVFEKVEEGRHFLQYVKDHPQFQPYRTEWTIYHEDLKLAGSIDMVYENPDHTLSIYDWKRCKDISKINTFNKYAITPSISHMPDSNFWHYALQLNTYKAILEAKYGKKVRDLFLVRLYPNEDGSSYELLQVPILDEDIQELFKNRLNEIIQTV